VQKHEFVTLFEIVPLKHDSVHGELDRLLEEDALLLAVKADLVRRYPQTLIHGRHSKSVEVILAMLVARHPYRWTCQQTELFVAGSITRWRFSLVYLKAVPDDKTLIK
jgi:hypothetical protein